MEIDIRNAPKISSITKIRTCDSVDYDVAEMIALDPNKNVIIRDSNINGYYLIVLNVEHANYLIKALEKAKELGWFNASS